MGQKCSSEAGNKTHISLAVTNSSGRNAAHLSNSNSILKSELCNSCSQQIAKTFREHVPKTSPEYERSPPSAGKALQGTTTGNPFTNLALQECPPQDKRNQSNFPFFHPFRCFILLVFPILQQSKAHICNLSIPQSAW